MWLATSAGMQTNDGWRTWQKKQTHYTYRQYIEMLVKANFWQLTICRSMLMQQQILTRLVIPSLSTTQSSFSASLFTSDCVKKHKYESKGQLLETSVYWKKKQLSIYEVWSLSYKVITNENIDRIKGFWGKTATWYKIKLSVETTIWCECGES